MPHVVLISQAKKRGMNETQIMFCTIVDGEFFS